MPQRQVRPRAVSEIVVVATSFGVVTLPSMNSGRPVALVTGASSGIGEATARRLVADGFDVAAVGRRADRLTALAESCPGVAPFPTDMADSAAVLRLVASVADRYGRLDVLVNNAGTARQVTIGETDPDFFRSVIDVNLVGPAAAIHAAWPVFLRQGSGCIVNVSSLAQLDPFPGFFAYGASKAGLHLLTVVAQNEGAEHGVRAFTVAPGVVETPLHRALMPEGVAADMRLEPAAVAGLIAECAGGDHDAHAGWTLAVVASGITPFIQGWVDSHPGGGVLVVER